MRFDGGIDLFFQFERPPVVSRSDESKKGSAVSPRSPNAGQVISYPSVNYARNCSLRQRTSHQHPAFVKACVDRVNRRINVRDLDRSRLTVQPTPGSRDPADRKPCRDALGLGRMWDLTRVDDRLRNKPGLDATAALLCKTGGTLRAL